MLTYTKAFAFSNLGKRKWLQLKIWQACVSSHVRNGRQLHMIIAHFIGIKRAIVISNPALLLPLCVYLHVIHRFLFFNLYWTFLCAHIWFQRKRTYFSCSYLCIFDRLLFASTLGLVHLWLMPGQSTRHLHEADLWWSWTTISIQ